MKLLSLAFKSAWNRRLSLGLSILSIAISITLLLGVDKIRKEAKNNFVNTISQTDLIVGARSGPVNLLLYSVFHIGDATNNISWETYQELSDLPQVKWAVPISLGDSHKGYRVMGTSQEFFKYYHYANNQSLSFSEGKQFEQVYETVLGYDVAQKLGYQLGDSIVLSHGMASTKFSDHADKPFTITGILKKTGTPVDRVVHVPLEGISAMHIDWQSGARSALRLNAEQALKMDLQPKEITAFMLGLNNRITTFRVLRKLNNYKEEPLLAIMPGATLSKLWKLVSSFEIILFVISALVLFAGLAGMLTTIISSLNERRREMAVLRAVGAHPYHVLLLFMLETLVITVLGIALGIAFLYLLLIIVQPLLIEWGGIALQLSFLDIQQWVLICGIIVIALVISLIPGMIAYRRSLQDGLMIRT